MKATRTGLVAVLAAAGLAAGCGGEEEGQPGTSAGETVESAGGTTLNGTVGPGFDIALEGTEGLTAGEVTLVVDDKSSQHNFHLTGPGGVDVSTEVGETERETFTVTLKPGEYTFVCDPHSSTMKGSFTVR